MKVKEKLYFLLAVAGALSAVLSFVLKDLLPERAVGILCGVGIGLFALGMSQFLALHKLRKNPALEKQEQIERGDERNMAIRRRAKALSGDIIQWLIMAAAWVSIILDAPLWVTLTAVGVFLLKTLLEIFLMIQYDKEM